MSTTKNLSLTFKAVADTVTKSLLIFLCREEQSAWPLTSVFFHAVSLLSLLNTAVRIGLLLFAAFV